MAACITCYVMAWPAAAPGSWRSFCKSIAYMQYMYCPAPALAVPIANVGPKQCDTCCDRSMAICYSTYRSASLYSMKDSENPLKRL